VAEEPIAAIHSGDEGKQISQGWIGFSEDDAQANRRRGGYQATEPLDFQRVEDNAFHLALGAFVREYFRTSKNEFIRSGFTDS